MTGGGGITLFGPWGRWSPWYDTGYGWGYGHVAFDPWRYRGGTSWMWNRYGGYGDWCDPWSRYPCNYYWFDPYWYASDEPEPVRADDRAPVRREMGSLRIKASPRSAKVYVNGSLVGTVDEFDGLANHLRLETGTHRLELRADGYQTLSKDVTVSADKTLTERLSMKKQ
jgi:PEGA domain